MADRFHVGQRVRRKYNYSGTIPVGTQGVVVRYAVGVPVNGPGRLGRYCLVKFDGYHSGFYDGTYSNTEDWLEPIPDDRAAFERFMVRVVEPPTVESVRFKDKATAK